MKSFDIDGKQYEFNRPTPARLAAAEAIVQECELFSAIIDLPKILTEDKEKFAKLSEDWKRLCGIIFKTGFNQELALDNLIYPDEVRGAAGDFFSSAWERTQKELSELVKTSQANTKSQ